MPTSGPLIDSYGRIHDDLRISVTDRCGLRCLYCMPDEEMEFLPHERLLSFDGLVRVAAVARKLGVKSVRLTGGEPLARKGIVEFIGALHALGFEDLSLTTNGMEFSRLADSLVTAGLTRVNFSCDSLRGDRFAQIRRRGSLDAVLASMDVAESVGLAPIKVNVVLMRTYNDDEIVDFAAFAREKNRIVRFIEFMPLDNSGTWNRDRLIPGREVVEKIATRWPLEPLITTHDPAPATRYRFKDGVGEIGIIASVTEPFCGTCNRLRITAEGMVRNCLFSDDELTLVEALRIGDDAIEAVLRQSVWGKYPGHGINDPGFLAPRRTMSMIGG